MLLCRAYGHLCGLSPGSALPDARETIGTVARRPAMFASVCVVLCMVTALPRRALSLLLRPVPKDNIAAIGGLSTIGHEPGVIAFSDRRPAADTPMAFAAYFTSRILHLISASA